MDIITSRSIHRRTSAGALRICSELNVIPIMVSSPAKFLVTPFRDANIDRDQSTWVHGAAGCRFEYCAAASVGLARDPSVAGFLIFVVSPPPGRRSRAGLFVCIGDEWHSSQLGCKARNRGRDADQFDL
jgi:hypothetical protein